AGVEISEMSSGCICCSLVGDFGRALHEVEERFHPDRILIEPSGVGKLSDVVVAVQNAAQEDSSLKLNSFVTVADVSKVKVYMKNFGEFYNNQIESAGTIILSRTQNLSQDKLEAAAALLRAKNPGAVILTTPWDQLDGKTILSAIEKTSLEEELLSHIRSEHEAEEAAHAHHHHEHGGHGHGHEHHHHEHDHEEHEHHHDHEEHEHRHEHDHERHDHGEDCACGCHDHDHHGHHHADEVFASWGRETVKSFAKDGLERILAELDLGECGAILRAKGIVPSEDGGWLHFDYVPEEWQVRTGPADYTGRLCVIGAELKEDKLAALFGL
ncbi:MAG: GTP-binding protein, partial [Oscillospiraceae bacterium]